MSLRETLSCLAFELNVNVNEHDSAARDLHYVLTSKLSAVARGS